jgi:hypothetical protein
MRELHMTRKELETLVDELIEAAAYRQSCEDALNHTDGYYRQNMDALELADRDLLELRESLVDRVVKAGRFDD